MTTNTARTETLNTKNKPWKTLSKEDKILIEDLVILEYFGFRNKSKNNAYSCVQNCDICDGKETLSQNSPDILNEDSFSFSKENRKKIIKRSIHEFFEAKWKKQQERKSLSEMNELAYQVQAKKQPGRPKTTSSKRLKALEEKYVKVSNRKSITIHQKRVKMWDSIYKITERKHHVKTNIHMKNNDYKTMLKEYVNKRQSQGSERDRRHTFQEDRHDSRKTKSKIREHVSKISSLESTSFNFEMTEWKSTKHESRDCQPQDPPSPVRQTPMDEIDGSFFIDKELVNREMYVEGLAEKKWNPTQVLYELCSMCQWGVPEFVQLSHTPFKSFHFSVRVKDCTFIADQEGKTKKAAKHLASTKFLQFLGFKVESKPKPVVQNPSYLEGCSVATGRFLNFPSSPFSRAPHPNKFFP